MDDFTLNYRSEIFTDLELAITFMVHHNILLEHKNCPNCGDLALLKTSVNNDNLRIIYRCGRKGCQKRIPVHNSKKQLTEYIFLLYLIFINLNYYQIKCLYEVTNPTISKARKTLRNAYRMMINRNPVLLGGDNIIIQLDETVLCRRGNIRDPTHTDDETPDTVWIFGGVDTRDNFFVSRVENRQAATLTAVLEPIIRVNSVLHTDGYPSYPLTARNLNLRHEVVNHSEGFINENGIHTNGAEGLWSVLKSEMRRQHGVKRNEIDEWLGEFTFRKRFLRGYDPVNVTNCFIEILRLIFN